MLIERRLDELRQELMPRSWARPLSPSEWWVSSSRASAGFFGMEGEILILFGINRRTTFFS
jgi:hypothetical protein